MYSARVSQNLPPLKSTSPKQSLGTLEAHRLWQLNLQSARGQIKENKRLKINLKDDTPFLWSRLFRRGPTFTLHALAKQTLEQPFAVLADGRTRVSVDGKRVRHLHPSQHHLLHPDGPTTPGQDPFPRLLVRPLLQGLEARNRDVSKKSAGIKVKSMMNLGEPKGKG